MKLLRAAREDGVQIGTALEHHLAGRVECVCQRAGVVLVAVRVTRALAAAIAERVARMVDGLVDTTGSVRQSLAVDRVHELDMGPGCGALTQVGAVRAVRVGDDLAITSPDGTAATQWRTKKAGPQRGPASGL